MNELKLETVTLGEDPAFLLRMVRAYFRQDLVAPDETRQRAVRAQAEAAMGQALRGPRLRVMVWVLANARRRVRDRENLRFERTRVFGVARRLFVALGHHLAAAGALAEPRDVFYLAKEEIFACLDGTGVTTNLKALVQQRRAEFERYAAGPAPADRFETFGPPAVTPSHASTPTLPHPHTPTPLDSLHGTGCCPGVVRAPVRVVRDPQRAGELAGHILVAERTDPGWTLLFPAVEGLLVQRGSLLSHSAIVAREIGLPCVVAIPGLLERLRDDEWVEMDGTTGAVRRLEGYPEATGRE
jgi:rifampicin phosphotransferase